MEDVSSAQLGVRSSNRHDAAGASREKERVVLQIKSETLHERRRSSMSADLNRRNFLKRATS